MPQSAFWRIQGTYRMNHHKRKVSHNQQPRISYLRKMTILPVAKQQSSQRSAKMSISKEEKTLALLPLQMCTKSPTNLIANNRRRQQQLTGRRKELSQLSNHWYEGNNNDNCGRLQPLIRRNIPPFAAHSVQVRKAQHRSCSKSARL